MTVLSVDRATRNNPEPVQATEPRTPAGGRLLAASFTVAVFLGSTLLFLVQPLVARFLLPLVGGSAALWNTAMVFFQVALLAGYGFAHLSLRRVGTRRHPWVQSVVLIAPLLVLPLAVPGGWTLPNDVAPAFWVLGVLCVMVGLPFFALATTSPTLQVWFAATDHPKAKDPYFLYATGNIGSVLALVGYPLVFEPLFSLRTQARLWASGYVVFLMSCLAAAWLMRRHMVTVNESPAEQVRNAERIPLARRARWLLWSFIPSALMLGVTIHIATDLASFPLLWIVPLLLYLVTFIVAFASDSPSRIRRSASFLWLGALPLGATFFLQQSLGLLTLLFHLAWFFAGALLCHSKLAADRPETGRLTDFYLMLSVGGALGGVFSSLLAPMVFDAVLEYPVAIALVLIVAKAPSSGRTPSRVSRSANAVLLVSCVALLATPTSFAVIGPVAALSAFIAYGPVGTTILLISVLAMGPATLHAGTDVFQDRSFFGVYTVVEKDGTRSLVSGTTVHGSQLIAQSGNPEATTYYHRSGPAGQVFDSVQPSSVGVIGLGVGTLADYGRPGDSYVFVEIDQLVVDIASDPALFEYLSTTRADVEIVVDDGRHGLAQRDEVFDVLVVDAFGSDAIPVHLLTSEAMELYLDRVGADGTLLVHISNRHFDLKSVIARTAAEHGRAAYGQSYEPDEAAAAGGASATEWVAVAPASSTPSWMTDGRFEPIEPRGSLWTDDFSNVLSVLKL